MTTSSRSVTSGTSGPGPQAQKDTVRLSNGVARFPADRSQLIAALTELPGVSSVKIDPDSTLRVSLDPASFHLDKVRDAVVARAQDFASGVNLVFSSAKFVPQ
jgi:copper chaperone CopZ